MFGPKNSIKTLIWNKQILSSELIRPSMSHSLTPNSIEFLLGHSWIVFADFGNVVRTLFLAEILSQIFVQGQEQTCL